MDGMIAAVDKARSPVREIVNKFEKAWSFFVFIPLPRNEKQAARAFLGSCACAFSDLAEFFWLPNFVPFLTFVLNSLLRNASFN